MCQRLGCREATLEQGGLGFHSQPGHTRNAAPHGHQFPACVGVRRVPDVKKKTSANLNTQINSTTVEKKFLDTSYTFLSQGLRVAVYLRAVTNIDPHACTRAARPSSDPGASVINQRGFGRQCGTGCDPIGGG